MISTILACWEVKNFGSGQFSAQLPISQPQCRFPGKLANICNNLHWKKGGQIRAHMTSKKGVGTILPVPTLKDNNSGPTGSFSTPKKPLKSSARGESKMIFSPIGVTKGVGFLKKIEPKNCHRGHFKLDAPRQPR